MKMELLNSGILAIVSLINVVNVGTVYAVLCGCGVCEYGVCIMQHILPSLSPTLFSNPTPPSANMYLLYTINCSLYFTSQDSLDTEFFKDEASSPDKEPSNTKQVRNRMDNSI